MIISFLDADGEGILNRQPSRKYAGLEGVIRRKLVAIDSASQLTDLTVPPGNRLEALRGDRKGKHSIRINKQYRICFRWKEHDAYEVEIVDYH